MVMLDWSSSGRGWYEEGSSPILWIIRMGRFVDAIFVFLEEAVVFKAIFY